MRQEYPAAQRPAFIDPTPDECQALGRSWPLISKRVEGFARRVGNCQADIDDMTMEAHETFWKLGPERYDLARKEDLAYVSAILIYRMCKVWGGGNQKKQEESERVVRAMIGPEVLPRDEDGQLAVACIDLLDEALMNEEEFGDIIARIEDADDVEAGDDDGEGA